MHTVTLKIDVKMYKHIMYLLNSINTGDIEIIQSPKEDLLQSKKLKAFYDGAGIIMQAIREYVKIINHKLFLELPENLNFEEVEVIVIPMQNYEYQTWNEKEIKNSGKIGFHSKSFVKDDEDYSKW